MADDNERAEHRVRLENLELVGTPAELGAQVFVNVMLPIVMEARFGARMGTDEVVDLYSGFIGSALGSFAAEFGVEAARLFGQKMTDGLACLKPAEEKGKH